MAKFNFYLRDQKSKTNTLIVLVTRWNKKKLMYSTKETITPKFWQSDPEKRGYQRVVETKSYPAFPETNTRLDWIKNTAQKAFTQFLNDHDNRPPTPEELKQAYDRKLRFLEEEEQKDLFGFIEWFIKEAQLRVNTKTMKALANGTISAYNYTLRVLKEYKARRRVRVDFDTINLDFYQDFSDFLTREKNLSNNTLGRTIKTLKVFLNDATERGQNTNIAFKSKRFKVLSEKCDGIYLNEKELSELAYLDLSCNERLERVRDLFLVGCWTGLRFSDFSTIKPENIDGDFIELVMKKTGDTVVIPIHPIVRSIMEKYKDRFSNSLPPALHNQKMNYALKEIGKMIPSFHAETPTSITKGGEFITTIKKKYELIMTHTARRSFATNQYLSGLQSLAIMKITGHRTEKAFLCYIKVTPKENAKILQLHWANREYQQQAESILGAVGDSGQEAVYTK